MRSHDEICRLATPAIVTQTKSRRTKSRQSQWKRCPVFLAVLLRCVLHVFIGQISVRRAQRGDLYRFGACDPDFSRLLAGCPTRDGDSGYRIGCNRRDDLPVSRLDGSRPSHRPSRNDVRVTLCPIRRRDASCARSRSVGQRKRICGARPDRERLPRGSRTEANLELPAAVGPVAALGLTTGLTMPVVLNRGIIRQHFFDPI